MLVRLPAMTPLWIRHSRVRSLRLVLLWLCLVIGMGTAHAEFADLQFAGATIRGSLAPGSDGVRIVTSDGGRSDLSAEPLPLWLFRQVDFRPALAVPDNFAPLRRFELCTGETIHGEFRELTEQRLAVRLRGGSIVRIPASVLATIQNPIGERDILYDSFESASVAFGAAAVLDRRESRSGRQSLRLARGMAPLKYDLPREITAGRVECWFHNNHASTDWMLELTFRDGPETSRLRFGLGRSTEPFVAQSGRRLQLDEQPLSIQPGWHRFAVRFDERGVLALIDHAVLCTADELPGALQSIRIVAPTDPSLSGSPGAWIDDLIVRAIDPSSVVSPPRSSQDCVVMSDGSLLFGQIERADNRGVRLTGSFGSVELTWPQLQCVQRHQTTPPLRAVAGQVARIRLQSYVDRPDDASDGLVGAIVGLDDERLWLEHPLLGRVGLPISDVRRIEPRFRGRLMWLDPGGHHLGDELRNKFRRPAAEGPTLEGQFRLEAIPEGAAWFAVDVAELEPCGPETPPNTPFLAELRGGGLRTEVFLNDVRVGDLNRHISRRPATGQSERIRMRIPSHVLREGVNKWRIVPKPSRHEPSQFDDCELSRIALELHDPPRLGIRP